MGRETWIETWQALAHPKRSMPIVLVGAPLVAAQWWFTRNVPGTGVAVVMVAAFLAVGPASWRVLFPTGRSVRFPAWRAVVYAALGFVCVLGPGVLAPRAMGLPATFLTVDPSLAIMLGMFWVGGWGLGRDIDQELQIAAERARAAALEREKERAQLLALRSHLDPHFLFNTINAIAEWCQEDPAVAEQALLRLATMLRTMLSALHTPTWPLREELALIDDLLELHSVRDPERFSVRRVGWQDTPDLDVPPMLLLPLVENAMKHGPAAGHAGEVRVALDVGDLLVVTIENPGPYTGPRAGGHGLDMVRKRLDLAWGRDASLALSDVGGRTRAVVRIPRRPVQEVSA